MNDNMLTVKELSEKLKVPASWVYAHTRETGQNALPRFKVGKYLRFEWDKVETWLIDRNRENE